MIRGDKSSQSYPRHFHSGFSIGIIEDGCREYFYGGTRYFTPAGSIIAINPGEVHSCTADRPCSYEAICPGDPLITSWLGDQNHSLALRLTRIDIRDPDLYRHFKDLFVLLKRPGLSMEKQTSFLTVMAALFGRYGERSQKGVTGIERRAVAQAREYINDNYGQNISLEDLSRLVGLSPYHFLRVFGNEVGLPPHEYQTQVRVKRARSLLARGHSIAWSAAATGFADQAHFTRCFKKHMGVTPGRYRAMLAKHGELFN